MSERQKARRAKRLLSMAEQARGRARAELAQTHQRLQVVEAERQAAEPPRLGKLKFEPMPVQVRFGWYRVWGIRLG